MGRMVECGGCEHRFQFAQEVIIRSREKTYVGDIRRPGIQGVAKVPKTNPAPVSFEAIQYEASASAADVNPLSPQRKVSLFVGASVIVLGVLIFVLGSEQGGLLQGIGKSKRLVIGGFLALVGAGFIVWGTRKKKAGWVFGGVGGVVVMILAFVTPVYHTVDPAIANAAIKPLATQIERTIERKQKVATAEEMMALIGYGPVEKAMATHTTADREGSERVIALWIPDMEERFKFQIQKYLERILELEERPSYLRRRSGSLFIVGGVELGLEEIMAVVEKFGTVNEVYPEIRLITMSLNGDRFLGVSRELLEKLTDPTHQAFYVRNLQELNHIDINRVADAAQRLAAAEPKRFRKEIAIRLKELIGEQADAEFKGIVAQALTVWSEPGDGVDLIVARSISELIGEGEDVPRSMIDFLIKRQSPTVIPLVENLWTNDPQTWESAMVDIGTAGQESVAQKLDSGSRAVQFSAVNILKRVGTSESVPALRALKAQIGDEEMQLKIEDAIKSIQQRPSGG